MRSRSIILVLFLISGITASAQGLSPRQVVRSFYIYDRAHSQVVNHSTVNARRQWLSNSLYKLMRAVVDADIEHAKQYPDDKPYFGDGFPFQPYEESCGGDSSRYHVGSATVRSRIATVPVTVTWPRCRKLKPIVYKVKLVRWRSGWKIDDLIYDNGNTLKANLKYASAGKEGT